MNPPKKVIGVILIICVVIFAVHHRYKPMPEGLNHAGQKYPAQEVSFLADSTWIDSARERKIDQEIFDSVFDLIGGARKVIVVDMFLYNDFQGPQPETHRLLSTELTAALIVQKIAFPDIQIIVITDPLNTVYGGMRSEQFNRMRTAGISVVETDLSKLRDSNPAYSWFWRLFIAPFGNTTDGHFSNPLGNGKVTARSYLELANFKANHRKTIFADTPAGYAGLVTSANPHDGSSAHRNIALRFSGAAALDLLKTENAVLVMSGHMPVPLPTLPPQVQGDAFVQIVTERAIKDSVLKHLNAAGPGDRIDLMMFYVSDHDIIDALIAAKARGAALRIMLDPNKDAFGHEKDGVPNRPVAARLHKQSIAIRWANVAGEQSHAKMLLITPLQGQSVILAGSANYTRRNLGNLNLETNVVVTGEKTADVVTSAQRYFDAAWNNENERRYSLPYDAYGDNSLWLRVKSGFMERSGISTF